VEQEILLVEQLVDAEVEGGVLRRLVVHLGVADGYVLVMVAEDFRAHGKDERVPVKSLFDGSEYLYRLVKALSGGR